VIRAGGWCLLAAAALTACASAPPAIPARGQVGVREVDPGVGAAARLELPSNETFQRPLFAADNPLPDYPPELLARNLPPQPLCMRVGIAENGEVMLSEAVREGSDCVATIAAAPEFVAAARDATVRWRFEPAFRCVHPPGVTPEPGYCEGPGVEEIPQAVSLVFRFVFEQVGGRGSVRLGD
jgi:hypothetical protein